MNAKFNLGARVKIHCEWSEANKCTGIIAYPPKEVRSQNNEWHDYFRCEKNKSDEDSLVYWVELDRESLRIGEIEAGEFDQDSLTLEHNEN